MGALFLGVDVGLSGVRAVVLDASGRVMAEAREPAACDRIGIDRVLAVVRRVVGAAVREVDRRRVAAMALCAFGPAPVALTAAGGVADRVGMFAADAAAAEGGDDLAARIAAARARRPDAWAAAAHVCDLTGCLVFRLTGALAMDGATADDFRALDPAGLPDLPPVWPPAAVAGDLAAAEARIMGLPDGLPLAVGCYDSNADLAACGFGPERPACIVLGSTLVLGRLTASPLADDALRSVRHVGEGWFSGGWTNVAGSALDLAARWFRPGDADGPQDGRRTCLPIVLPHFMGERAPLWDQRASGAILGLTAEATPADLQAAFREGVALSALDLADRLSRHLGAADRWTVTGGGTRNPALLQDLADALDAPLDVPAGAHRSVGPAALAARAAGAPITFPVASAVAPRPDRAARFRRRLHLYRRAQAALSPLFQELREDVIPRGACP
jgi:sugar (pentulose or hexulose) kinase